MSLFYFPFSSFSAFVPYKPDSLEKTKNSGNKFSSQTSTVSQEYELPVQIPMIVNVLRSSDTNLNCFQKKLQKKQRKGSLKIKKGNQQNDYEYRPNKRVNKKQLNSKLNQNRNILPNTIHQLFSFAQRRNRSGTTVQRIFQKHCPKAPNLQKQDYSITKFYIYQKHLKNKIGNYVTEDSLRMVCSSQISPELFQPHEEKFYNKVFRILVLSYLQEEANCSVLMSRRMYNDKKIQHIRTNRYIAQKMRSNFREQNV